MRAGIAIGLGAVAGFILLTAQVQAAYVPPAGYIRTSESFSGDAFAVAADGKVAIGTANFAGGATVRIFNSVADAQTGSAPLRTFADAAFKAWGDLTFVDGDTLLFSENADLDTVYRARVSSGAVSPLAPAGSVPNAGGVIALGSTVYAIAAAAPGTGALYAINEGSASAVLSGLGTGYLSGVALDAAGNFLLTDTNDPSFQGNPGKLLRYSAAFMPIGSVDLAGGGGSGAYDVVVDSEGDVFVTSGSTITRIPAGEIAAERFGSAFGGFPFLTSLDYAGSGFEPFVAGSGALWVNAGFSDDGAIFGIVPAVPEPAAVSAIAVFAMGLLRRSRRAQFVAGGAMGFTALACPSAVHAEQFFATQVVNRVVGGEQQAGFTDPALALGGPRGGGTTINSVHCYNLGNGGSLTLGFDRGDERYGIYNGLGFDFIISENSFYDAGDGTRAFAELAWVEVSSDGTNFARFPAFSETPAPVGAYGTIDPGQAMFFAGVRPVLANVDENAIDPFDRIVAGGDPFDLMWLQGDELVQSGVVDLDHIRHVRLVDIIGDGSNLDGRGNPIYDPTGFGSGGADIDAVAVIHGTHLPEPGGALTAAVALGGGVVGRRRR